MDWHLVDIDPSLGSGWTGYTFNRELFPDPRAFMAELHDRGLAVSLNVHPADGIRAHEDVYPRGRRADGDRPRHEAAGELRPDRPGVPRGLPRGGPPPARGRRRRLLVAGLAAGRRHEDPRARPAVAAQPLPLPRLRAHRAAADVLPLRRDRQPPLPGRLLRRHRRQLGVAALPARVHGDRLQRRLRLVEPRHRRALLRRQGRRARQPLGPVRRLLADPAPALDRRPLHRQGAVALRRGRAAADRRGAAPAPHARALHRHDGPARARGRRAAGLADVLRPPGRARRLRRAEPVHVRHRGAGRADHRRRPTRRPASAPSTRGCPRASGSTPSRASATAAGARSRSTARWTRSPCWCAPAPSCRWPPTAPAPTCPTGSSCTSSHRARGRSRSPRIATTPAGRARRSRTRAASS